MIDMQEACRGEGGCLAGSSPCFPSHAGWDTLSSLVAGTEMGLDSMVLSSSTRQDLVADLLELMGSITAPGQNYFNTTARG